jgi:hypothetical protein
MAAVAEEVRPKRRVDRREVDNRLRVLYDWLLKLSDDGGMYTGLNMWMDGGRGAAGHLVLINEMPSKVLVTMTAVGMIRPMYRDVLDLKYAYIRDESFREVTDRARAIMAGISVALFSTRVFTARRYVKRNIDSLETLQYVKYCSIHDGVVPL